LAGVRSSRGLKRLDRGELAMRRHKWKLLGALAVLAAAIAVASVLLRPQKDPGPVTFENWERVDSGMKLEELEAFLGPHVDKSEVDYGTLIPVDKWVTAEAKVPTGQSDNEYWMWQGKEGVVFVRHDTSARTTGAKMWAPRIGSVAHDKRNWRNWFR
jgi:hypothetical protein